MFRYCHFICSTFNFDSFSRLIDGDVYMIYIIYMQIVDFARTNNIPFDTSFVVDGAYLQSLLHHFYKQPPPTSYTKDITNL